MMAFLFASALAWSLPAIRAQTSLTGGQTFGPFDVSGSLEVGQDGVDAEVRSNVHPTVRLR